MPKLRAPFIWTPRQQIAKDFVSAMKEPAERHDGMNRWFLFRTTIDLANTPSDAPTRITVDGRYLLYVNGSLVGRGPVRCSPLAQRFDTYDIAPQLKRGRNVVAVLVHTYGVDTAFYEGARGMWRSVFGEGGLWVDGPVVNTGQAWRCTQTAAWEQDVPRTNDSLGFLESFDANLLSANWADLDFDDSGWDAANVLKAGGGGPDAMYGGMEVTPFPVLIPRGIAPLAENFIRAQGVRWIKAQVPQPDLPIHRRLYDERLQEAAAMSTANVEELLRIDAATTVGRTFDGADTAFTVSYTHLTLPTKRIV